MRNASFLDYRMPTCLDVPMIDTIIVEVPNPAHPYGVRGVGETPIVAPPAAIANAIYRGHRRADARAADVAAEAVGGHDSQEGVSGTSTRRPGIIRRWLASSYPRSGAI